MQRDKGYILDILNSAIQAVEYLKDMTFDEFADDIKCQDAVIRRIEIIGEAAGKILPESSSLYPDIPWREMKLMRNLLIHEYDDVDIGEVWRTVKNDLPPLIAKLPKMI